MGDRSTVLIVEHSGDEQPTRRDNDNTRTSGNPTAEPARRRTLEHVRAHMQPLVEAIVVVDVEDGAESQGEWRYRGKLTVREKDVGPHSDAGVVENVAPRDPPATFSVSCGGLERRRGPITTPAINFSDSMCPQISREAVL